MKDDKSDRYVLQLRNIKKRFGDLKAVDGVSLNVRPGEVVSIIGPSGCGKSTLLRCINHLVIPEEGEIYLNDELMKASEKGIFFKSEADINRQRAKVGMVFQSFNLWPHLTVRDNVSIGPIKVLGKPKDQAHEISEKVLAQVGLSEKLNAYPSELSGGQQQRVGIARALAMEPEVILFDEPTSSLDPELVSEVLKVIADLATTGTTMLIVTHEIRFAEQISDRIVFMDSGRIVEEGTPEEVIRSSKSERLIAFLSSIS
ncbi:GlnQ ABC-type polar amino acid transport system, ATPase component [Burkholderiaceae bacterium]